MWEQLGWFSGLVCAGSVAGAVAWGAYMQALAFYYGTFAPDVTRQQFYARFVYAFRWFAVFNILYSL